MYPVELQDYKLPNELGSYLFWNAYKREKVVLDCDTIGIPNRENLLSLCDYKDAVNLVVNKSLSANSQPSSGSDSEKEEDGSLPVLTLSVM